MAALLCFPQIILSSILFINLFLQIHYTSAQPPYACNNDIGNYTQKNSKFQLNLNNILSSIASQVNPYGFYNGTSGDGVDQVKAIALCRGDIDIESCRVCVKDAANNLTYRCPNQKEATIWFDLCMFRYSNKSILGIMSTSPGYLLINTQNASNVDLFIRELRSFAGSLVDQAYNGSFRKFAARKSSDPNSPTIYGLMQCTPDITPGDCLSCLDYVSNYLSGCCYNRMGARFISPSCTFRYETYSFFNESNQTPLPSPLPSAPPSIPPLVSPPSPSLPPTASSSLPPPTASKGKSRKLKVIIIVVVCIISVLLVPTLSAYVFITKRRSQNTSIGTELMENEELEAIKGDTETKQYGFSLIRSATNDFSTANFLGKGGFGEVYKGVLSNDKKIAVKRLSTTSTQGENEFINEVKLLAKLQHKCLVRLLGFCLEKTEKLLIYEFMENGSLDNILFGTEIDRAKLGWGVRYNIINSVAKGLVYLHEDSRLMIIHRDLKASNILLDEKMNAKISDFGTARLFDLDESEANTTRIAGTMGYMAPEYAMHGLFSVKSDVYSYGVLLLEIISGKRNYYTITEDREEGLLSYAYKTWRGGRAFDLIDTMLTAHPHSLEIIIRCVHIALLCVQENVGSRPTMATVIIMLQSLTVPLSLPSEPGFYGNTKSWLSKNQASITSINQSKLPVLDHDANINDQTFSEETDSYLYPR